MRQITYNRFYKRERLKSGKKRTKKSERKRDLKYGSIASISGKTEGKPRNGEPDIIKGVVEPEDSSFKKELRKNLIFVFSFFAVLFVLYFLLTKTNLLDPVLKDFGLQGLYKK